MPNGWILKQDILKCINNQSPLHTEAIKFNHTNKINCDIHFDLKSKEIQWNSFFLHCKQPYAARNTNKGSTNIYLDIFIDFPSDAAHTLW